MTAPDDTTSDTGNRAGKLVALLLERETARRKAEAEVLDVVGSILDADVAGGKKYGQVIGLLQEVLRLSPTEASRRVKRARALCSSTTLTGEQLSPKLEFAAAAMRAGELADSQLDAILSIVNALPPHVNHEQRQGAERSLVEHAKQQTAKGLHNLGRRIHDHPGHHPADHQPGHHGALFTARRARRLPPGAGGGPRLLRAGARRLDPEGQERR